MTDHPKRSRWKRRALIAFVLLLPVQYVLSVGPAVCFMERGYISEDAYDFLYAPLSDTLQQWPSLYDAVDAYAVWWQGL